MVRKDPETKTSLNIFEFGRLVRRPRPKVSAARDRAASMERGEVGGKGASLGVGAGVGVRVGIPPGSGDGITRVNSTSSSSTLCGMA